ncbi:hypothetical protein LIER_00152 [Lithospermum erythrorhizon]|uniref:Uncharacterized protein n=1 Tax=Lithospermum erythrorhizon TaxID=34254 RepID=A0AAV3NHG3_LITER
MEKQKRRMSHFYNRRVRSRQFIMGDLVLRVMEERQQKNKNKLNTKWEGPYRVRRVIEDLSGKEIDHTWHGVYLKKYYA